MRKLLVPCFVALAALIALVAYRVLLGGGSDGVSAGPQQPATSDEALVRALDAKPMIPALRAPVEGKPLEALRSPPAAPPSPSCVVLGRVLDEDGAPLEGAVVRLGDYKGWREGLELPRLEGRYDMRGFETSTDLSGTFRIEAPPPTVPRTSLWILADRFRDSHTVRFGDQAGHLPPLAEGTHDLGDIRLATTGAITGRVTDQAGRPLADVTVSIGPERNRTLGSDTWTGPDGTFTLAHAPVGTYGVGVKREGYLQQFRAPVSVARRQDTPGIDFGLAIAPTIEGTIVDEQDQPIADAELWGWPEGSGTGAGATSGPDGRFTIHLAQDEPLTLGVTRDGYHPWGDNSDRSTLFAPGTVGLRIEMRPLASTRFVVLDEETGAPVTRFGLRILENEGSRGPGRVRTERRPPPLEEHPSGTREVSARPGIDLFLLAADGYLFAVDDVQHDSEDAAVQTVRMRRGASLRGRAMRDGVPAPGIAVELVQLRYRPRFRDGMVEIDESSHSVEASTRRTARADGEGRFEVAGLAEGAYCLTLLPGSGAPRVLLPVRVERGPVDMGDLELVDGATLDGIVLVPPGVLPAGLQIRLGGLLDRTAVCDSDGRYRFDDLPAGEHVLTLARRAGVLDGGPEVAVRLAPGESRSVTIDASDRGMCEVDLTLDLGPIPARGRTVHLLETDGAGASHALGVCDETGRAVGFVRAFGTASVAILLDNGLRPVHPRARLDLPVGGKVQALVPFDLGSIVLCLPPGELPLEGHARLELVPASPSGGPSEVHVPIRDGRSTTGSALVACGPDELRVTGLVEGSWHLTVELVRAGAPLGEAITLVPGVQSRRPRGHWRAERSFSLRPGERLEIDLR